MDSYSLKKELSKQFKSGVKRSGPEDGAKPV